MPEIKHNFTGGKMNKDLDERIVPNGQYRHAENIQVSTSDGGEVGTVQNILGNTLISNQNFMTDEAVCIASIADEKNDKIYWFIKDVGDEIELNSPISNLADDTNWYNANSSYMTGTHALDGSLMTVSTIGDNTSNLSNTGYPGYYTRNNGAVLQLKDGKRYEVEIQFGNNDIGTAVYHSSGNPAPNKVFLAGYSAPANSSYRPLNDNYLASSGYMSPSGNVDIETNLLYKNNFVFDQASNGGSRNMRLQFELVNGQGFSKSVEIQSISFFESGSSYILEYDIKNDVVTPVVVDNSNEVLQFSSSSIITGINIIDNMLFWTDNINEPKKINIDRCKQGSADFISQTQLFVKGANIRHLHLDDITVIKKAPKSPLTLEKDKTRDASKSYTGIVTISTGTNHYNSFLNSSMDGEIYDFSSLSVGDKFQAVIETDINGSNEFTLDWSEGDTVLLKKFDSPGNPPTLPLDLSFDWNMKAFITNWNYNEFSNSGHDIPFEHIGVGAGWVSLGGSEYEVTAGSANQKLVYYTYHTGNGEEIKDGRHYEISFDLDENSNSELEGRLWIKLFNNDTGTTQALFVQHPSTTTYNASLSDPLDDLSASDAGTYSFIVNDQYGGFFVDGPASYVDGSGVTIYQNYPNSIVFENKTGGGNTFKGKISNVNIRRIDSTQAKAEFQITSINGTPPVPLASNTQLDFAIDSSTQADILFEKKLPRFSYRYKYEDGEYSSFAPFTNVVFDPGGFVYNPSDGYNFGMNNTIKEITIGGTGQKSIMYNKPDDVVSVDILYKEEGSPAVYVVDTLKNDEDVYKINKETINGVLPENQLLRLWDNVPVKALSQEVIGNRVIYGNYTQNYNLSSSDSSLNDYLLNLSVNVDTKGIHDNFGRRSIKSEREYQLGVVYTDKYGRETPVLTNSDCTVKLDKSFSDEQNSFLVQIKTNGHPINMEYFKFYVKDTSGEYYNMAMDRYYDAEDGNIWLAFPSVDRNKVDIDDNIILKKGIDSNEAVADKAKYKVIDISNEAPDYIKKEDVLLMKKYHSASSPLFTTPPQYQGDEFNLDPAKFANSVHQNFASHFNSREIGEDYYIIFSNSSLTSNVSERYKLLAVESGSDSYFTIDGKFGHDVMQFTDDPTGLNTATFVKDATYLTIIKETQVNSPKFDGRFFVKISKDAGFNKIDPRLSLSTEYVTTPSYSKKIYMAESSVGDATNHPNNHGGNSSFWEGYASFDTVGTFNLGRSATKTIIPSTDSGDQIGTLKEYWQRRYTSLETHGDYDYAPTSDTISWGDPSFRDKWSQSSNMFAWKAYFRGINTETLPSYSMDTRIGRNESIDLEIDRDNNKFEDVWFITKCKYAAGIPTDRGLEVSNNYPEGSGGGPTIWDPKREGWKNWTSSSALELSFGGISPNAWQNQDTPPRPDNDYSFFDIGGTNLNYAATNSDFVSQLAAGSRFVFREDPTETVYTITDVNLYHKITYDNLEQSILHTPGNNENHYKAQSRSLKGTHNICDDNGNLSTKYRCSSFLDASNFTVIYKLFLDKPAVWNPVSSWKSKISGGLDLKIDASDANATVTKSSGEAKLVVDSITGTDVNSSEEHKLQVGMVLYKYQTPTPTAIDLDNDSLAVITDIQENSSDFTIYFKCYDGRERDLNGADSSGKFGNIDTDDDLYFAQYTMNGLSKNSAKNLNFFNQGGRNYAKTGVDAIGYTIQFITPASSETSDDVLASSNPAIFETEPKKDKDLDIYYEASKAIPITTDSQILDDIIPVGSRIEHVGSGVIPPSTTITSIDSSGVITLSTSVQVERSAPVGGLGFQQFQTP